MRYTKKSKNFIAFVVIISAMAFTFSCLAASEYYSYLRIKGNTDYTGYSYGLSGDNAFIAFPATVDGKAGKSKNKIVLWREGWFSDKSLGAIAQDDPTEAYGAWDISKYGSGTFHFEFINNYSGAWISKDAPMKSYVDIYSY